MKYRHLLFLLLLAVPLRAVGEEPLRLTLEEAVQRALDANYDVLRARERLALLEGQITEVKSQVYPQLGLEGSYFRTYSETFLDQFGGVIAPAVENNYAVRTTARQLLFSWGRASTAVDIAQDSRLRGAKELAGAERDVKLQVHQAFYGLLLTQRLVEVAEERLEQRKRTLEVAQKRFDAGVVNEFEVIRARVDVANARTPVIQARNQVRQAKARLNNLLARTQALPLEAVGELEYDPLDAPPLETVVERAVARRPELEALRVSRKIAEESLQLAHAEDKPQVNLQAEYGYDTQHFENLGPNRENWSAGVVLSLPLFDGWRTRGLVAQASSQLRDVEIAREQLEQVITLEAKVALDDLTEAREIIEAAVLTVDQAQTALELAETSYRYGVATNLDVTDAQLGLTVARTDYARALHDYMLAKARVLAVMDEL